MPKQRFKKFQCPLCKATFSLAEVTVDPAQGRGAQAWCDGSRSHKLLRMEEITDEEEP